MSDTRTRDDLPPQVIEAIVTGRHSDPFGVLGPHGGVDSRFIVRTFAPQADEVSVTDEKNKVVEKMDKIHPDGLFAASMKGKSFKYRLKYRAGSHEWIAEDPYRYGFVLGEMDTYLLAEGRHRKLYEHFGAHPRKMDGVNGVAFAVWAPNARRVSVVGDFNGW
ncbi:MAG: 1,4-alpha-glucan branching enzyme, partial [Pseudomonadota bacterium]